MSNTTTSPAPRPVPPAPKGGVDISDLLAPAAEIDTAVAEYVASLGLPRNLEEAVRYAALGPGKRTRPLLVWHSCIAAGGEGGASLPAGVAIELIHAFSLVHDDLPGLDNDDLRRGRPTLHRHTSEAMAILAGDALLTLAFKVVMDRVKRPELAAGLIRELADSTTAMIVGQVYDTLGDQSPTLDAESLNDRVAVIHKCKTGALIRASCRMGALCAGAPESVLLGLTRYGEAVGLMFQIVDDLLDVTQTTEHLGKKAGKDSQAGKLTYPGVHGVAKSRAEVMRLNDEALGAVEGLGPRAEGLRRLCRYLAVRSK